MTSDNCGFLRRLLTALMAVLVAFMLLMRTATPVAQATPLVQGAAVFNDEEIVLIGDEDGQIRVLDPNQIRSSPLVEWESPDGDWRAFDLGDFNNDGDMEIVAIKGGGTRSGEVGTLTVFDPVVVDSTPGLPEINGIPWRILHSRVISGRPTLVSAGNFDPNTPGDEIVYGFLINEDVVVDDEDDRYRFTIIKAADPALDGTQWVDHISAKDESVEWDFMATGDMGDGGADEIVLIDEANGELNVYKIGVSWERIFAAGRSDLPYRWAEIADYYEGGYYELLTSREVAPSLVSAIYYLYTPGSSDGLNFHAGLENEENLQPYPRVIFAADVNGSGDDEAFLLRREQGPRLFSRNHGSDPMPPLERDLDSDDGYRAAVGGDFDADGREEVAVLRSNNLRIFALDELTWTESDYLVSAATTYVRSGDLDGVSFAPGPHFALREIDPPEIEQTVAPDRSAWTIRYDLINDGSDDVLSFNYSVTGDPDWATITMGKTTASRESPADIYVTFDSTGLARGTYTSTLVITGANPDILNNPFSIPIRLNVFALVYLPLVRPPLPVFPVLGNGDFDTIDSHAWREISTQGEALIYSEGDVADALGQDVMAYSSPNLAWLGGVENEVATLQQEVLLPARYPDVCLSFRHWIGSNEKTCGDDRGHVEVDGITRTIFDLCRDTNTDGWQRVEVSLADYVGETVEVRFRSTQDGAEISNWFLDDIILCDGTSGHPCE